jgi:nucleoside-triphosphatase THEP1
MDDKEYKAIMATVKTIKELLQKRLNNKVELLNTLQSQPLDNTPDAIQKMREEEAARVRAVMQEQKDLIEIINALFPNE